MKNKLSEGKFKKVKIGASNGSGFMYCGDYRTLDYNEIDHDNIERCIRYAINNQYDRKNIEHKLTLPDRYYKDYVKYQKEHEEDVISKGEWLEQMNTRLERLRKTYRENIQYIIDYKPLEERKIIEVYGAIQEHDTSIILVEGTERCDVWDTEEYERSVKSKTEKIYNQGYQAGYTKGVQSISDELINTIADGVLKKIKENENESVETK